MCEQRSEELLEGRSSQSYTQLMQLRIDCCLKLPLLPQPEDLPSRPSLFFSLAHVKDSYESRLMPEYSKIHFFKSLFHYRLCIALYHF